MNTDIHEQEREAFISRRIKRILASKALRSMRKMADDIKHEELTDRKLLKILSMVLPAMILAAVIFIYRVTYTT